MKNFKLFYLLIIVFNLGVLNGMVPSSIHKYIDLYKVEQDKHAYYYHVLGVKNTDEEKRIRGNYLWASNKYHPNKYPGATETEIKLITTIAAEINNAFEMILKNKREKPTDYVPQSKKVFTVGACYTKKNSATGETENEMEYDKVQGKFVVKQDTRINPYTGNVERGLWEDEMAEQETFYQPPKKTWDVPTNDIEKDQTETNFNKLKNDLEAATNKRVAEEKEKEIKDAKDAAAQEEAAAIKLKEFKKRIEEKDLIKLLAFMDANIDFVHKPENLSIYMPFFEQGLMRFNQGYLSFTDIEQLNRLKKLYEKCKDRKKAFLSYWPDLVQFGIKWGGIILNVEKRIKELQEKEKQEAEKKAEAARMAKEMANIDGSIKKAGIIEALLQTNPSFEQIINSINEKWLIPSDDGFDFNMKEPWTAALKKLFEKLDKMALEQPDTAIAIEQLEKYLKIYISIKDGTDEALRKIFTDTYCDGFISSIKEKIKNIEIATKKQKEEEAQKAEAARIAEENRVAEEKSKASAGKIEKFLKTNPDFNKLQDFMLEQFNDSPADGMRESKMKAFYKGIEKLNLMLESITDIEQLEKIKIFYETLRSKKDKAWEKLEIYEAEANRIVQGKKDAGIIERYLTRKPSPSVDELWRFLDKFFEGMINKLIALTVWARPIKDLPIEKTQAKALLDGLKLLEQNIISIEDITEQTKQLEKLKEIYAYSKYEENSTLRWPKDLLPPDGSWYNFCQKKINAITAKVATLKNPNPLPNTPPDTVATVLNQSLSMLKKSLQALKVKLSNLHSKLVALHDELEIAKK